MRRFPQDVRTFTYRYYQPRAAGDTNWSAGTSSVGFAARVLSGLWVESAQELAPMSGGPASVVATLWVENQDGLVYSTRDRVELDGGAQLRVVSVSPSPGANGTTLLALERMA